MISSSIASFIFYSIFLFPFSLKSHETRTNGTSVANGFEAKMAVGLALWLLWNDATPGKVTILTPYQGQVSIIRKYASRFIVQCLFIYIYLFILIYFIC
jgi:hypothetical protein